MLMVWGAIAGAAITAGSQMLMNRNNSRSAGALNAENIKLQREFAQNGISWKVADAKRAGIHPLYALGASTHSFTPVTNFAPEQSIISNGQDIGRAIQAGLSPKAKKQNLVDMQILAKDRAILENELLKAQIERIRTNPSQQAVGIPDGGDPGLMGSVGAPQANPPRNVPLERVQSQGGMPWQEHGAIPELGWSKTPDGYAPVPSDNVTDRIEDKFIPEMSWVLRNQIAPNFGKGPIPPRKWLPKGAHSWKWSYLKQQWLPNFDYRGVNKRIPRSPRPPARRPQFRSRYGSL